MATAMKEKGLEFERSKVVKATYIIEQTFKIPKGINLEADGVTWGVKFNKLEIFKDGKIVAEDIEPQWDASENDGFDWNFKYVNVFFCAAAAKAQDARRPVSTFVSAPAVCRSGTARDDRLVRRRRCLLLADSHAVHTAGRRSCQCLRCRHCADGRLLRRLLRRD